MKKVVSLISAIFILISCSKHKNPTPVPVIPTPGKASLTFPDLNKACTNGIVITTTTNSINFQWSASDNTDSYDIHIKNLSTGDSTIQNTIVNHLVVILTRNTPYSWYIVSKSTKTEATGRSDTWKFYDSGPGVVTYAPFPADIVSPTFGANITASATNTVDLQWKGSSVTPGTIVGYDIYFGNPLPATPTNSNVPDSFLNNVTVTSGTTYYWKVITKDAIGNTSDSGTYQFTVN